MVKYLNFSLSDCSQQTAIGMTTYSCRLLHGSVSWAAQTFNQLLSKGSNQKLEHWWSVIKTDKGTFYCLQMTKSRYGEKGIYVERFNSENQAIKAGFVSSGDDYWTEDYYSGYMNLEMTKVLNQIQYWSDKYEVSHWNCQYFCQTLANRYLKHQPSVAREEDRKITVSCLLM